MIKVSVIIPVYNTEKYLRKCLDSVCNQTLQDIEIICVNDCSPDGSLEILKEYASNDNRIKIINFTENKGVAVARNTAIEQAKGEYIGFVDSDDYVDLDFYEKLYNKAKETNSDFAVGRIQMEDEFGVKRDIQFVNNFFQKIYMNKLYFYIFYTAGLYRANLLCAHSIFFSKGLVYGEDRLFPLQVGYYANKLSILEDTVYHYVRNNDSITIGKKNENIIKSFVAYNKMVFEFLNSAGLNNEDYSYLIRIFLDECLHFAIQLDKNIQQQFYLDFQKNIFSLVKLDKFQHATLYSKIKDLLPQDLYLFMQNYNKRKKIDELRKNIKQNALSKVSIIIPIYNVEQYLPKCLESVINQTYKNLEIICVNDCSPDGSLKICQGYAQKDSRIKLINREQNGGLSAARNSGLEVASGEYVYFIDSDDYIDSDYIEKMVQMIEKHSVDMVSNTHILQECGDKSKPFPAYSGYAKQLTQGEFVPKEMAINLTMPMIYLHLYKKAFLDKYHLRFPEGYIHEDEYFQCISKIHLDALFVFYGPAYHYLQRENSIMASRKSKIEGYVKIFTLIYEFYKKNKLLDKDTTIKCFRVGSFACIKNEQEFLLVKDYIELISKDFEKCPKASTHAEKYIFNAIKESKTIDEYKAKVGKNAFFTYMTRQRMKQQVKGYKVSIIIPVYNTEKYLRKCLDSVCNQTLQDIEIICVNDCSPDGSLEILKEYASNDNRIKIINFTENKGVAVARNTAIEQAKGEYIGFVDSDDYVDLDFYEKLYNASNNGEFDIVKGALKELFIEKGTITRDFLDINQKIQETNDKLFFCTYFSSAIFQRNLLCKNYIRFPEYLINGEDGVFLLECVLYAKNIYVISETIYYYCRHNDSANSQELNNQRYISLLKSYEMIFNKLNNIDRNYGLDFIYSFYLSNCIKLIFRTKSLENKKNALKVAFINFNKLQCNNGVKTYIKCNYPLLYNAFVGVDIDDLYEAALNKSYTKFMSDNFRYKLITKKGF